MTPQDWTLLVIAAARHGSLDPVQLQKSLFLLGKKVPAKHLLTDNFYHFDAYDYGPFTSEIYNDAEELEAQGYVAILRPPMTRYKKYRITTQGQERAAALRAKLQPGLADYVSSLVSFTQSRSFNDLVSSIYKAYPEMRENSVFKE